MASQRRMHQRGFAHAGTAREQKESNHSPVKNSMVYYATESWPFVCAMYSASCYGIPERQAWRLHRNKVRRMPWIFTMLTT